MEVRLNGSVTAKIRHPSRVGALAVLTVGIYGAVWYYKINRELRDLGRLKDDPRLDVKPWLASFALTVPYLAAVAGFIADSTPADVVLAGVTIPALVSWFRTVRRVRAAEAQGQIGPALRIPIASALILLTYVPYGYLFPSVETFQFATFIVGVAAWFLLFRYTQQHLNAVWIAQMTSA